MANKKIQIKNATGDNLFPNVYATNLQDTIPLAKGGTGATTVSAARTNLDVYSKEETDSKVNGKADSDHTHTFTGTAKAISVTGTYSKTTGVTISSITPSGVVSKPTFSGTTTLTANTTSTNGVKVAIGISGGSATATKGSYTPAGSVNSIFTGTAQNISLTGTPSGSISLTGGSLPTLSSNTTSTGGISYVSNVSHTAASASGTKAFVTGITEGSLSTTSSSFIKTINGGSGNLTASVGGTSGKTLILTHTHTGASVGSSGNALTGATYTSAKASGTSNAVTGISGGGVTTTTSYLHFNQGALRSGGTFTGNQMSLSASYTPKGTVASSFTGTTTSTLVTGISYSAPTLTTSYLHATTTGNVTQPTFTGSAVTPTASITTSATSITLSASYTPEGTIGEAQ